jgi:hypothetical protein
MKMLLALLALLASLEPVRGAVCILALAESILDPALSSRLRTGAADRT